MCEVGRGLGAEQEGAKPSLCAHVGPMWGQTPAKQPLSPACEAPWEGSEAGLLPPSRPPRPVGGCGEPGRGSPPRTRLPRPPRGLGPAARVSARAKPLVMTVRVDRCLVLRTPHWAVGLQPLRGPVCSDRALGSTQELTADPRPHRAAAGRRALPALPVQGPGAPSPAARTQAPTTGPPGARAEGLGRDHSTRVVGSEAFIDSRGERAPAPGLGLSVLASAPRRVVAAGT